MNKLNTLLLAVTLAGALAAGCKKTPADCKKLTNYYCGENGTPEECKQAKDTAASKSGGSCAKVFVALKEARKQKEAEGNRVKREAAFTAERDLRKPIVDEMDKVSANRYELGEKLAGAKGAEKKKLEAEIAAIDARLNELMTQLNSRVQPGAPPAPGTPAPAPAPGAP